MLNLNCFAPLRRKSSSEGITAWVHSREIGKASLSSLLFLWPKTVPNKSEIFVCCTLSFLDGVCIQLRLQAETLMMRLLRLKSMTSVWDGMISALALLDTAHFSLAANY